MVSSKEARRAQVTEATAGEAWRLISEMFMARRKDFVTIAASLEMSPGDLHTLLTLEPGVPRAMRTLAETLRCDPSNVTWLIDRLEKRGLVERQAHVRDRRVKTVVLTPAGIEAQHQIRSSFLQAPAELVALGEDDLATLVGILAKVELPPLPL